MLHALYPYIRGSAKYSCILKQQLGGRYSSSSQWLMETLWAPRTLCASGGMGIVLWTCDKCRSYGDATRTRAVPLQKRKI